MSTPTWAQTPDLQAAEPETLLTAYASLTHRIDRVGERGWSAKQRDAAAADVRAQRDLLQAEILRRMGGAR